MKSHLVMAFGLAAVVALGATAGCASDTGSAGDEASVQGEAASASISNSVSHELGAPTSYELSGGDLHIAYTVQPAFSAFVYEDAGQRMIFHRGEIDVVKSEIGTQVSVVLHRSVDTGSTTFTLLIPGVVVGANAAAAVETQGITTIHGGRALPMSVGHQIERYTFTPLTGTARASHLAILPPVNPVSILPPVIPEKVYQIPVGNLPVDF